MNTSQFDVDKYVKAYIDVRDKIKELDAKHDIARKPLLDLQNELSGLLQKFMEDSSSEGIKTEHGTCYSTTRYTASLADPEAFMKFVIATGNFDLLDRRANATAVKDFIKENSFEPPGCNLNGLKTIGVRRK